MNFKPEPLPPPQTDFYHLLPVRCGRPWEKAQSRTAGAEDGSEQSRHREPRHRRDSEGFTLKTVGAVGTLPGISAVHRAHQRPPSVPAPVEEPPGSSRAEPAVLFFFVVFFSKLSEKHCQHGQTARVGIHIYLF